MSVVPSSIRAMTPSATRLTFDDYLDHIGSESARFRAVLADCDPTARVPACPDWHAGDLLWHLTDVQWFWSRIIAERPAGPEHLEHPERPPTYDGLLEAFDGASTALTAALRSTDPAEVAWSWAPEQTTGFTFRRQAHEALIHRLDAEQTAGVVTPLDPALATDGVEECLAVMYGGCPPWGRFTPGGDRVRLDLTDVGESLWVALGRFTGKDPDTDTVYDEPDLSVVDDPGVEPAVVIRAGAGDLDAWLWNRSPGSVVEMSGDPDALAVLTGILNQAIN
ncbi:maleylpyruvate isomerase family mycothiol-dependent enzyme [soil metagenome]